jgi:hypothetical protein
MNIAKSLSALSLAFTMIGGAAMLAPSTAHAGSGFISFDALKHNNAGKNTRPGAQANPHTRGCSAITRCRG